jgi:hypothetical protein
MTMFQVFGKLTRVPAWDGRTDRSVLLVYKNRGVMFYMHKGGFGPMFAVVFPPRSPLPIPTYPYGAEDVIPGVGARGVMLGMSKDQLRQSPFVLRAKLLSEGSDVLTYRGDRMDFMAVQLAGDRVSQLNAMGEFRTPEGLTNRSTIADIERTYGRADEYYQVVAGRRNPFSLLLVFPIALVLGLAAGLVVRTQMDGGTQPASRAIITAAVALAVSELLIGLVSLHFMGMSCDWKAMPVNMVVAGLTGAVCMWIVVALAGRVGGCWGLFITLLAVALVSQFVAVARLAAGPMTLAASGMAFPKPETLFVMGMCLTGRPRTD